MAENAVWLTKSPSDILGVIAESLHRRGTLLGEFEALRIVDGSADELGGLFIDKFGSNILAHLLLSGETESALAREKLKVLGPKLAALLEVKSLLLRVHSRDPKRTSEKSAEPLFGEINARYVISEYGVKYLVDPKDQVNAGLFLDMREVRRLVRESSSNRRVLNTFCFTGSLGCAALAGCAREVVQVDISKRILSWAKENFEQNRALSPQTKAKFFAEDTRDILQKEIRRLEKGKERYDLIIVDAPAFGSSSGKIFSFEEDIASVLELSALLISSQGRLILSTNKRDISAEQLKKLLIKSMAETSRKISGINQLVIGKDFRSAPNESPCMRGVEVRIE